MTQSNRENASCAGGRCELCGRRVAKRTRHHLIPRTRQRNKRVRKEHSKEEMRNHVALLCSPCHRMLHATFSEKELAREYNTLERLRGHEEVERFVT